MYRFQKSIAYYEMMILDTVKIDYDYSEEGKDGAQNKKTFTPNDIKKSKAAKLQEEWLAKKREEKNSKEWTPIKLSDLNKDG